MKSKTYIIFAIIGVIFVGITYFTPIWGVALQSIQYPKSMYPKGIRINFKFNGVYNGCEGVKEREELATNEGADCLMEMNAINHYIGMYPIVQGRNNPPSLDHPSFYVFDTQRDAEGHDVYDPATGQKIKIDVTPTTLKVLNTIMTYSPYIFVLFILLGLYFIATPKKLNLVAGLIPALVPFYFLFVYMYYLYWYGHNLGLHGGGAFAGIKPFMPTVFGEGKVAQFTTESYPYYGFYVALGAFVFMILAILLKRKSLRTKL
ncbi:MAG: hypothetical protein AB7D35_04555 [Bacteroidales bacterium]|jgi:hypothetical protein|nr:hypothetical protein [Bacteroidales bacterium]MDD4087747.1 hypothetical protein [Bacteroidales bacterium]